MKICLVFPRGLADADVSFPHGLLAITAAVKQQGYSCEIFDCNNNDIKISYDYLNTFDVIGLSVMTTQLRHAVEIADQLGKHVRVVWGGVHCLLDPVSIINKFKTHFVISGDGEIPFVKLLHYFAGKEPLDSVKAQNGISFYQDQAVINPPYFNKDLDALPDINYYDLRDLEKYIYRDSFYIKSSNKIPTLEIITSRGCSWDCSFCLNSIYRKNRAFHRSKSFEKIRRESEKIIDDFNIKIVLPRDEDFFANRKLLERWMEYAREKDFFWGASCRYNYFKKNLITKETLTNLVDTGLFYLGMSVEAGSEDLRNDIINKQLSNNDIYNAVETIQQSVGDRVAVNTSFVVDFPGDTKANKIETIKWMNYLSKNINVTFSGPQIYRPYPGTKLFELENKGKHKYGDIDYYLEHIESEGESGEDINYTSYFYSKALVYYYNWKIRFFQVQVCANDSTHCLKVIKPSVLLGKFLFECLFATINLRLKYDFWEFFYEPPVIGWVWHTIRTRMRTKCLGSLLQKIKK